MISTENKRNSKLQKNARITVGTLIEMIYLVRPTIFLYNLGYKQNSELAKMKRRE